MVDIREERKEYDSWTRESLWWKNCSIGGVLEKEEAGIIIISINLTVTASLSLSHTHIDTDACKQVSIHNLFFGTQDDKTFSILRKTLGSFLGNASDEDFPPDDWRLL